jgi:acyl-coenzyme A synthetase/AMP-(fatty) acid ligase
VRVAPTLRSRSSRLSDPVHDLTAAADPVAAFRLAETRGEPVALSTSGSTRTPRRVLRSTASWTASFDAVTALSGIGPGSRVWVPGPMSASMNVFAAVHASYAGAGLVGSPAEATHAVLSPGALSALLDDGAPRGLVVVVAGDGLSPARAGRAADAGLVVHHYYGAAELSFVAWGPHREDLRPFPGVEVSVRAGEVWVRSPYLCLGYDGAAGPLRRDADGWATVGDRGVLEPDGRLVVHGRPDAVTTAGATVRLSEVETVLRRPARGEVTVLGVPHPDLGTVLVAVLTDASDHAPLVTAARAGLTVAARPRRWYHLEALPLGPGGKVDRAALRDLVETGAAGLRPLTGSTVVP